MDTDTDVPVDHYVWKAFYIRKRYDDVTGELLATTKDRAMSLITDEAEVPNEDWKEQKDGVLYQIQSSRHHIVTVKKTPVRE